LRQAIEREEFVLHYQPKINLADGRISGLEALIRWNSDAGLIPPAKFIPVLEETGLILEVGQWAIRRAIQDYFRWRGRGLKPPPVAVNVSPIQLRRKDFAATVDDILRRSPGGCELELEITETLIMENLEENIRMLGELRAMGIGISIDDFGTGYSSLRYMGKLPVTDLKIDRAFISNITTSPDDTAIVSVIISLAHSLNLKVIAEGVETLEQAKLLKLFKCDQFQGFLFSPPVPAPDIESILRNHKTFAWKDRVA
jgi:EAL domain-containing protein (putative c-di-GMP-specific phosphodiesterase class I)